MMWQSEVRAWAVASAAVLCLSSISYRVVSAPALPEFGPTIAQLDTTLANLNAATGAWSKASAQQVQSITDIERDLRVELWQVDRLTQSGVKTLQTAQGAIDTAQAQLTHVGPVLDSIPPAVQQVTRDADTLSDEGAATLAQGTADLHDLQAMEQLAEKSERDATGDYAQARRGILYRLFRKLF